MNRGNGTFNIASYNSQLAELRALLPQLARKFSNVSSVWSNVNIGYYSGGKLVRGYSLMLKLSDYNNSHYFLDKEGVLYAMGWTSAVGVNLEPVTESRWYSIPPDDLSELILAAKRQMRRQIVKVIRKQVPIPLWERALHGLLSGLRNVLANLLYVLFTYLVICVVISGLAFVILLFLEAYKARIQPWFDYGQMLQGIGVLVMISFFLSGFAESYRESHREVIIRKPVKD